MTAPTTPTGILLGSFKPGTPEWDQARAGLCITATEIAAVMGLSPPSWQSRFSLWHKKAGLPVPPFQPSPAMEWGIRHEPTIAAKYAEEHPELTLTTTGTWRHADREWQRATPDLIGDDRIVEIKTAATAEGWGEPGTDEVPIYYRCQVIQQMDVLGGYRRTDFAVLIGNCDYREYTVWFDEADAKLMRDAAEEFLDTVRRGERPDPDGSEITYNTAKLQATGRDDTEIDIGPHLAGRYRDALDLARAMDDNRRNINTLILQRIGTAKYATSLGERVAIRTVKPDGTTHSLMPFRTGEKSH
ncbi:YqaJ viral recombinase family protein [Streptomyces syringium]|uniref:YqaJ viral recombinase family nuclease n=1 Tax=Streptomyces syringium TaxID=76729 RepID=UPI003451DC5B